MYPSALSAFQKWTESLEGRLPYMYLDVDGAVTTGIGNLLDSVSAAQTLPWKHGATGPKATPDEIATGWQAVKALQSSKSLGGGNAVFSNATDLRLSQPDIDALFSSTLASFSSTLRQSFPQLDTWPADAQMGLLGMAWALGPNFAPQWPKFTAAMNTSPPSFMTAAAESHISNGTLSRNAQQLLMFLNANSVQGNKLDPSKLYYPQTATPLERLAVTGIASNVAGSALLATGGALFLTGYGLRALFRKRRR